MAEIKEVLETEDAKRALDLFLDNPYWKKYYETAPSDACKDRIALTFYYSAHPDRFDRELRDAAEDALDLQDWKHLLKYCGNNPNKLKIIKKIKELSGE